MRPRLALALVGLATLVGLAASARAADAVGPGLRMDFDLWCTEEAKLEYARCAKRLPADLETFAAYRDAIERYEDRQRRESDHGIHLDTLLFGEPAPAKAPADAPADAKTP